LGVFVLFNVAQGLVAVATGWRVGLRRARQKDCNDGGLRLGGAGNAERAVRLMRAAAALWLLGIVVLLMPSTSAQAGRVEEYRAKANFLAAFPNFIDWPEEAFPSEQAPFLLCVFGDFPFGTSLTEMTRGVSIRGRRIEVRWVHKDQDLRACHILFMSRSQVKSYGKILKAVQGASVLTVGESPEFLDSGGAINFIYDADRLQFEVNMAAANDARLRISSNMLALARHVVTKAKGEAAKS